MYVFLLLSRDPKKRMFYTTCALAGMVNKVSKVRLAFPFFSIGWGPVTSIDRSIALLSQCQPFRKKENERTLS